MNTFNTFHLAQIRIALETAKSFTCHDKAAFRQVFDAAKFIDDHFNLIPLNVKLDEQELDRRIEEKSL